MSRRVVGPFNRVEGDLEVQLDIDADRVRQAWVVAPLFRGFERILAGKPPMDALVYAPRICGICSVAQSVAAATALAHAAGVTRPPNGILATNLILAAENIADHLTHFYLFFMPDFARPCYAAEPWFADIERRFRATSGAAVAPMLAARAAFLHVVGLLAGKWPHTLAVQPGGTTRAIESAEQVRLLSILHAFRRFLETHLYGDALESVLTIDSASSLRDWASRDSTSGGDFGRFIRVADALGLDQLGRAADVFLSYGAYSQPDGSTLFPSGFWDQTVRAFDSRQIREDLSHAWMSPDEPRHPFDGKTQPDAESIDAYTWCKAPRLAGRTAEVGALARQLMAGQPVVRDFMMRGGGSVTARIVARLLELARVTVAMELWLRELKPGEPYYAPFELPEEADAQGLIEAARGSLGHWISIRESRIANYQLIAPTTWNFSPRDADGQPGPLEQALVGAPLRPGETDPVAVQHIVRSFDPCMVCTVH